MNGNTIVQNRKGQESVLSPTAALLSLRGLETQ